MLLGEVQEGHEVATIVPVPLVVKLAPVPTTIAAVVLVLLVRPLKATLPAAQPVQLVAAIVPVPLVDKLAPEPTTIIAVILVPLVMLVKDVLPPPELKTGDVTLPSGSTQTHARDLLVAGSNVVPNGSGNAASPVGPAGQSSE